MLAAVPSDTARSLEVLRLILSMFRENREQVPEHLEQYFDRTLKQALDLSTELWVPGTPLQPEAVQLAAFMASEQEAAEPLKRIKALRQLAADAVDTILSAMDGRIAA